MTRATDLLVPLTTSLARSDSSTSSRDSTTSSFVLRFFSSLLVTESKELEIKSTERGGQQHLTRRVTSQQGRASFRLSLDLLPKLCCMLPGFFFLFVMMLMLFVAGWVLPCTFHVITAILTMINITRNFQRRWRLAHAFCFVGRLALIARGRPRHTLCRATELAGG